MVIPLFMLATDATVLYLAMPSIAADLAPAGAQSLWIIHIGEFMTASTMITFGLLTRRVGARRLLLVAVAVYGAASLVAAFATSAEMLIAARAFLGIAAAAFTPAGMVLIRSTFRDERQYSVAFAIFMAAFTGGMAVGPPFGGVMLEHFHWGSVFLINVPIAAALLVGGPLLLAKSVPDRTAKVDVISALLSCGAILGLVYGLQEAADRGLGMDVVTVGLVGLVLLVLFLRRQRRTSAPLLDLGLFRVRAFTVMLVILFIVMFGGGFGDMLVAQYLQVVRPLGPLEVGLLLLPPAIAGVLGTLATPLLTRWGTPALNSAAVMFGAGVAGAAGVALLSGDGLVGLIVALTLVALLGAPFITLLSQIIIGSVPEKKTGSATAVQEIASSLGGASSIALLGAGTLGIYRRILEGRADPEISSEHLSATGESFGAALAVYEELAPDLRSLLSDAVGEAFTIATQVGYGALSVTFLLVAVTTLVVRRHFHLSQANVHVDEEEAYVAAVGDEASPAERGGA